MLGLQARRLEGELDVKLAAYGKLCSSFDGDGGHGAGPAAPTDQVRDKVCHRRGLSTAAYHSHNRATETAHPLHLTDSPRNEQQSECLLE